MVAAELRVTNGIPVLKSSICDWILANVNPLDSICRMSVSVNFTFYFL